MAKKQNFYVVWKGHNPGVYGSWAEAKFQIDGFGSALYKAFPSKELAEKAFMGNPADYFGKDVRPLAMTELEKTIIGKPILDSISVDAACSGNPGDLEFRAVHTKTKKVIFQRGPYPYGTVNIGEFLALVLGLIYLQKHHLNYSVYSDSKTAIAWVRKKKANTKLEKTPENEQLFEMIKKAEHWLQNNTYTTRIFKWETEYWGEIPADYGRK
ncbi:MAG: ribonuclease H family protein [Bacteroidales bacterium]|jgi:ribonuclease HI|nr:ribonuclease H family protein [Bacteroidales bacterium]